MPTPSHSRTSRRRPSRTRRRLIAVTSLGVAGFLAGLLSGCGSGSLPAAPAGSFAQVSGNWQFSSTAGAAAHLSSLGGSLAVEGTAVTGMLHALGGGNQCVSGSVPLAVTGSIDTTSRLNLTGPVAGGTLTMSGTLSTDRKSVIGGTYTVTGGSCAFPAAETISARSGSPMTGQQYQPVNGTYAGTLTSSSGEQFPLTSVVTQSTQPDSNGVYHVSGTANSPGNSCLPFTLPATASTVDGGSITTTYSDTSSGTSITGAGTSSPDGKTITITSWTVVSSCGADSGTGLLTQQ